MKFYLRTILGKRIYYLSNKYFPLNIKMFSNLKDLSIAESNHPLYSNNKVKRDQLKLT